MLEITKKKFIPGDMNTPTARVGPYVNPVKLKYCITLGEKTATPGVFWSDYSEEIDIFTQVGPTYCVYIIE